MKKREGEESFDLVRAPHLSKCVSLSENALPPKKRSQSIRSQYENYQVRWMARSIVGAAGGDMVFECGGAFASPGPVDSPD